MLCEKRRVPWSNKLEIILEGILGETQVLYAALLESKDGFFIWPSAKCR